MRRSSSAYADPHSARFGSLGALASFNIRLVHSDNPPPLDVPPMAASSASVTTIPLKELGNLQKEWSLAIHPEHLALSEPGGERPYVILRDQMMKSTMLIEHINALGVNQPRKLTFKLPPQGTRALADWIGNPALAAFYLKRRYSWVLPIAIIWLLGAIPVAGMPVDYLGIALGSVLLLGWVIAKYRPHPMLFILDGIWMLVLGGRLLKDVFVDGRSKGWLLLAALLVWVGIGGFRYFARFRGTTIPRQTGK